MPSSKKERSRGRIGYGSSYRKGTPKDDETGDLIDAVLGGQVWKVKPDAEAKAATPCLWMQAGVVNFKNCSNYYDCISCKYDLGMRKQVDKGRQISWQAGLRKRPELDRICRHSLTNRIAMRVCAYDYNCASCDFDQFFEDVWTTKTKSVPLETQQIKGFDVPMGYYFHNGHTWARIESGGLIRIGLDDFSLKLLGKPDAFDLPLMGKELRQNSAGWGLKRRDHLADMLSPIDGVIVEVNQEVRNAPEIANREPYGDGWLFLIKAPDIKKSMKTLMEDARAMKWISDEVGILEGMIEDVAGPLAADGGYLKADVFGNVPDLGWDRLTKTFLKT